jgi:hypothetical protein
MRKMGLGASDLVGGTVKLIDSRVSLGMGGGWKEGGGGKKKGRRDY